MKMYHGSTTLFNELDLSHILQGNGKVKFGYGVYLTSSFASAAHYSDSGNPASPHYVYVVEIPEMKENNCVEFKRPVDKSILERAAAKLGKSIPEDVAKDGKEFRKFLAKALCGKVNLEGEKAVADFLDSIGVYFTVWPYNWRNPNMGYNCAVFNAERLRIVQVYQVELNGKGKLIEGSQRIVWSNV